MYCTMNKWYVKGVKASGTDFNPLNVMYVEGVKRTYTHIFTHNVFNYLTNCQSD